MENIEVAGIEFSKFAKLSVSFSQAEAKEFVYTLRQTPVNYKLIKQTAIEILTVDSHNFALVWGISLNLEGLQKKDGRYVKLKGLVHTYDDLIERLQEHAASINSTVNFSDALDRINASKKVVTVSRLARAFAPETILYLKFSPNANHFPKDLSKDLPDMYRFLNAPYGMADQDIKTNHNNMLVFYTSWQEKIDVAYSKGWAKQQDSKKNKKRNWAEDYKNYIEFRGIKIE